jgi:hypothetical protein
MKQILVILLFLTGSMSSSFSQNNYFVSPSGNNADNGDTTHPWQTIQYAVDHSNDYDTINIDGTFNEKITISHSNLFLRNAPSKSATIDASSIASQNAVIAITDKSNITIDNIEICNNIQNDAQGILVDGSCSDITISHCKIHDIHFSDDENASVSDTTNAQGIIVYGSSSVSSKNIIISYNELYDCRLGYSEGIAINGNVDSFEVAHNIVHDITNIGIDVIGHEGTCSDAEKDRARNGRICHNILYHCLSPYATSGGIYVDGGKNTIIENNISHDNGYGIEIGCENVGTTTDSIIVRNNILYHNEIAGLALGGYDYPDNSGIVKTTTVSGNTFFSNNYRYDGSGEIYFTSIDTATVENNIFYTSKQDAVFFAEGNKHEALTLDYNLYYCADGVGSLYFDFYGTDYDGLADFQAGTSYEAHAIGDDPHFVTADTVNPDFHICSDSPAIDAGNPTYSATSEETDIDGEVRVKNNRIDIGSDEYDSTTLLKLLARNPVVSIFPNPASEKITVKINTASTLTIFSLNGKKMAQYNANAYCCQININFLPAGIYLLKIDNGTSVYTKRFVKR